VFKLDPTAAERQIAKLQAVRARRDGAAVQAALAQLGADCASERNVMPAVLRCVKAYATVGEICQVWREVFGEYVPEAMRF
jgi:methylmalonyl-CoA mutase N-terminal domain/subunit